MEARRVSWPALGGVVFFMAACDGGTPFDPVALNQAAQEVLNAMESSQASQSLAALGPKMTVAAPALLAATLPGAELLRAPDRWARDRALTLQRAAVGLGPQGPADHLIPPPAFGKTFTYNTETQQYQLSGDAGAPTNGIRFRLYAVANGAVTVPLQDIGYVELTEPSASSLGLRVLVGTLLDYQGSATLAPTSVSVTAQGFVSNGTIQVDFDLSLGVSQTTGVSVDYAIDVPENATGIRLEVAGNLELVGTATITIDHQDEHVVLKVTGSLESGPITGTIEHQGEIVVNISGTKAAPIFTDPGGTPLTQQQIDALEQLAAFIDDVFVAFAGLLSPALKLLGLELFL